MEELKSVFFRFMKAFLSMYPLAIKKNISIKLIINELRIKMAPPLGLLVVKRMFTKETSEKTHPVNNDIYFDLFKIALSYMEEIFFLYPSFLAFLSFFLASLFFLFLSFFLLASLSLNNQKYRIFKCKLCVINIRNIALMVRAV